MSKRVVVLGCDGNMGQRYSAILNYLGFEAVGFDRYDKLNKVRDALKGAIGTIVATPTGTHYNVLRDLIPLRRPILCEKPVTMHRLHLAAVKEWLSLTDTPLQMVTQYRELVPEDAGGSSHYNYFKHGQDGLHWDCIQIIGLSNAPPEISETSPVWDCQINGVKLNLSDMDLAYVTHVKNWILNPEQDFSEIEMMHNKVHEYIKGKSYGRVH